MSDLKTIPTGVKIIAILYYIGAGFLVLSGLLSFVGGGMLSSALEKIPILGALGSGLFIILGIILLGLGVLDFFIARGLWKAKKWARIAVIILTCLGILMGIIQIISGGMISSIVEIAINGFIVGYLLLNKKVKETFV